VELFEDLDEAVIGSRPGAAQQRQAAFGIPAVAGVAGQIKQGRRPRRVQTLHRIERRLRGEHVTHPLTGLRPQPPQRRPRRAGGHRLQRLREQAQLRRPAAARTDGPDEHGPRHSSVGQELHRGPDGAAARQATVGTIRAAGHPRPPGVTQLQDGLAAQLSRGHRVVDVSHLPIHPQDDEHGHRCVLVEIVQALDRCDPLPDPPAAEVEAGGGDLVASARQAGIVEQLAQRRQGAAEQTRVLRARRPYDRVELRRPVVGTPRQDRRQPRPHVDVGLDVGRDVALVDAGEVHPGSGDAESDQVWSPARRPNVPSRSGGRRKAGASRIALTGMPRSASPSRSGKISTRGSPSSSWS
jgi:hypothetical protein